MREAAHLLCLSLAPPESPQSVPNLHPSQGEATVPCLVPLGKPPSPSGFLWEPSPRWVLWLGPKGGPLSLVVLQGHHGAWSLTW